MNDVPALPVGRHDFYWPTSKPRALRADLQQAWQRGGMVSSREDALKAVQVPERGRHAILRPYYQSGAKKN